MPRVSNVGGSLTGALALFGAAWAVRAAKQALRNKLTGDRPLTYLGRFFAVLSPASVEQLVATNPLAHLVIDIRSDEVAIDAPLTIHHERMIHIPVDQLASTLAMRPDLFLQKYHLPPPQPDTLLVLLGNDESIMHRAAGRAALAGFSRTAIVRRGVDAFRHQVDDDKDASSSCRLVSRHALSALYTTRTPRLRRFFLIDVRRGDERTLFGSIRHAKHLPLDQLVFAISLPSDLFRNRYGFEKPHREDCIIFVSRSENRAKWAARVAQEEGFAESYVLQGGVCAWRCEGGVAGYASYEINDVPPEPEVVQQREEIDIEKGLAELASLGLT